MIDYLTSSKTDINLVIILIEKERALLLHQTSRRDKDITTYLNEKSILKNKFIDK